MKIALSCRGVRYGPDPVTVGRAGRWLGIALLAVFGFPGISGGGMVRAQVVAESDSPRAAAGGYADRVLLQPSLPSSRSISPWQPVRTIEQMGTILRLSDQELLMEIADGEGTGEIKQFRWPADQLLSVEPAWRSPTVVRACQLFDQRKYQEFVQLLRETDLAEVPDWQQLLLLGKIVQALDATVGPVAAGRRFLLYASAAPAMMYADLPLCWTVAEPGAELSRACLEWIESEDEAARLMGASWLLLGLHGQRASQTLERLQASPRPVIAQLATVQGWRLSVPTDTMKQLPAWFAYRDRMIAPLALGPTEFLADRLTRIGQTDLAIGQLLRIAAVQADRRPRARRALTAAGELLERSGQSEQAAQLAGWITTLDGAN